jgi:hypothetical protein
MRYVVEVPVAETDLYEQMNRMRGWLDHRRFELSSFRLSRAENRQIVHVVFKSESEATAFAAEFDGSLLASPVPAAAIA